MCSLDPVITKDHQSGNSFFIFKPQNAKQMNTSSTHQCPSPHLISHFQASSEAGDMCPSGHTVHAPFLWGCSRFWSIKEWCPHVVPKYIGVPSICISKRGSTSPRGHYKNIVRHHKMWERFRPACWSFPGGLLYTIVIVAIVHGQIAGVDEG